MNCRISATLMVTGLLALSAFAAASAPSSTSTPAASAPTLPGPEKYTLAVLWIAYSDPPAYIFTINHAVAYKDMDALKRAIAGMPPGSTINWAPSDLVIGGEPLRTKEELEAFKKFCEEKKLTLVIIPEG